MLFYTISSSKSYVGTLLVVQLIPYHSEKWFIHMFSYQNNELHVGLVYNSGGNLIVLVFLYP